MLSVNHLSFRYSRRSPQVLKDINLELNAGEIGILLGKNGSGKTTLFKNILGICDPDGGDIRFDGEDFLKLSRREKARRVAYVPQEIHFGALSVFDSILMGRIAYFGLKASRSDYEVVERILKDMRLEGYAERNVDELSGGERQKIAIARAMAQEPKLEEKIKKKIKRDIKARKKRVIVIPIVIASLIFLSVFGVLATRFMARVNLGTVENTYIHETTSFSLTLAWDAVDNAEGYHVYQKKNDSEEYQ
jgi:ABC-type Fe3+/spermidine/putrescine transport system ATPase subunit